MKYLNTVFKISIILIALGFLTVYYQQVNKNRYIYYPERHTIFDSQTGKIYKGSGDNWDEYYPVK